MIKILDSFFVNKYCILKLNTIPKQKYTKIKIDGMIFEPVPIYDGDKEFVAIVSDRNLVGKVIEFL